MNYAKFVGAAMQLFPKKIAVTVIDEITQHIIGKFKIPLSQLPAAFDKPTVLEVENNQWRVVKAEPVSAEDFSITKKLSLHILQKNNWQDERLLFNVPTRHAYHPLITHEPLFHDFSLLLPEEDWRQMEYLPISSLPAIQEEMGRINYNAPNVLWGYKSLHLREQTAQLALDIPLTHLCDHLKASQIGNVKIDNDAFVDNGIAIQSENYTYYGLISGERIVSLCLPAFEYIDDEFMQLVTLYGLVLADWCSGRILMIDTDTAVMEPIMQDPNDATGLPL